MRSERAWRERYRICAAQFSAHKRLRAFRPDMAYAATIVALREMHMKAISNFVTRLVKDEQGGEVLEYALIAGLIVVAAIAVIGAVGTKVVAKWTSLNSSM